MQKAKVLTQRSAVALVNGGVSPNVPASDPSPRHAGLHETSALIMGNAKSQGLVLAQRSTAALMRDGVSPNMSALNPPPLTCWASRDGVKALLCWQMH